MDSDHQADKAWLLSVQRKLYQWSRQHPDESYRELWNWIIDLRNLRCAWARVATNQGKRTAGIDGKTVGSIRRDLGEQLTTASPPRERVDCCSFIVCQQDGIDIAFELASKSAGLRRSLPEKLRSSLADLVRSMNCYYSNLIEGHDTHPIDIERALKGDYSTDTKKRDLQLEARAHITVQQWIDAGGLKGRAVTADSIREIHQRFCAQLPQDLLWVEDPKTKERIEVIPGEFRDRDVAVDRHIPVSAPAVPRFLKRFAEVYGKLGKTETIIAAAAHHRLVWIHPFLDGNGRVARLMSHATLLEALDNGGVWSIARGLARNVDAYKGHLAACDLPRRNDLDGGGHLNEETMIGFTRFFLISCIDQVSFMENLMQPDPLRMRILLMAEEEIRMGKLPPKAGAILEAVLYRGEILRAETPGIFQASERSATKTQSSTNCSAGICVLVSFGGLSPAGRERTPRAE